MIKIIISCKGRIDKILLKELKKYDISRSYLQKLIINKNISINDKFVSCNYIVKIGDIVKVILPEPEILDLTPQNLDFEIIYEDEDIAIINKPNDLIVHPSQTKKKDTLVNGLLYKIKNLSDINGIIRPGIVHRIDKKTTGLLVIAKNNNAHKFLSKEIKDKNVQRYYLALVHGKVEHEKGSIDAPIGRDLKNRKKMSVTNKNSKSAITYFKVVKKFENFTLLECKLSTGRTHQIRVHMNYISHPIFGDNTYGILNDKNHDFGQFLHAYKLKLIHPRTNKIMIFKSELPKEFSDKIKELEKSKTIND